MKKTIALLSLATACLVGTAVAQGDEDGNGRKGEIKRVLLISIDGMHAVDFANCVASKTCPTLGELGESGVTYTRTTTSRPSDSFPGLMALVTGGTPRTVGAFYDVAYDRVLAPPKKTTGNGLPGEDLGSQYQCKEGQINGTQTEVEEGVEIDETKLNGGGAFTGSNALIDGGVQLLFFETFMDFDEMAIAWRTLLSSWASMPVAFASLFFTSGWSSLKTRSSVRRQGT